MEQPYHPSYTSLNPAAEARRYTTETVHFRKVTLTYDWLDPERNLESWLRRMPYRLKKGSKKGSWIVRYFEFRAGISPISQAGFIGDLWISWSARDPSVWFKVDEVNWERWGGCASSVRERMDAKHPFLDKAYLWFDPKDYFFLDELPDGRPKLRWERPQRIRRAAPPNRIIDPDCSSPPKRIAANPVHLPSVRTIVRAIFPHMPQIIAEPRHPQTMGIFDQEEDSEGAMAVDAGIEDPQEPFLMEDIVVGDDVQIDWDDWGSDGEGGDETTRVGDSQPPDLSFTPSLASIAESSQTYQPSQLNSSPTTPFKKFKPPRRYSHGVLGANISTSIPCNTPASSFVSTSSTAIDSTSVFSSPADDIKETTDLQEHRALSPRKVTSLQKPSQRTLQAIVEVLRGDGYGQSGTWILLPPEISEAREDLAPDLPAPILDLEIQTSHKIRDLLRWEGFKHGILVLNMWTDDDGDRSAWTEIS